MAIIHIVLFEFKASAEPSFVEDTCKRMVDLGNKCIHPTSQKPYITTASGGRQTCVEDKKAPYTHAFVLEFASEEDRKYYTEEDPAHWEFKKSLRGLMSNVGVVDFTPGEY